MSASFTPDFKGYTGQGAFRFWCQTALPLIYDDSLSYYELLNKMVVYLNNVISDVGNMESNVNALLSAYNQLQDYVNTYFDNLDVQEEINHKLDEMAEGGTLSSLIAPFVADGLPSVVGDQIDAVVADQIDASVGSQIDESVAGQIATPVATNVTSWLNEHVTPVGSAVIVDESLSISGAAADAKKTGELKSAIEQIESDNYFEVNKSKLAGNYATINDASDFTRNWAQASTTALVQGTPITNAVFLKKVSYNVGSSSLFQAHYIGLCTISGTTATITHLLWNAGYFTGIVSVKTNFNLDPTKEYYFFLICNSGLVQWDIDNTGAEYYTFSNPTSPVVGTTVAITTNTGASVNIGELEVVYKTAGNFITEVPEKKGIIIVAKEGGDYATIGDAIQNANDSASNPVTIILCPGEYKEHITLLDRYISIVGVNRDTCIIKDNSGRYNNDPIKISGGKWSLENLSLISTHTEAGGWIPSWVFPDLPSYALHIDNGSAGGYGVVKNCYLYSENLNALGAGTHNGETIRIEDCIIVRNTTDANYISSNYKGAVACHSPNIYDDSETASYFNMYNCDITCNLSEALQLRHLAVTAKMKSVMVGNTLVANGNISNIVAFTGSHTSKTDYIEIQSHGNSTNELNG